MRDHAIKSDQDAFALSRLPVMRERQNASIVRAAMDLQQRAGNRSVADLVEASRAVPDRHPLAALSSAEHMPTSPGTVGGSALSVQREPCIDCPPAARAMAAAGPEAMADPGQTE